MLIKFTTPLFWPVCQQEQPYNHLIFKYILYHLSQKVSTFHDVCTLVLKMLLVTKVNNYFYSVFTRSWCRLLGSFLEVSNRRGWTSSNLRMVLNHGWVIQSGVIMVSLASCWDRNMCIRHHRGVA